MTTMTGKKERKKGMKHIKEKLGESLKRKWESKVMHGQYIRSADRQLVGEEDTLPWLSRGDLKGESDSEITDAQHQALETKCHATKILQTATDSKRRQCQQIDRNTQQHTLYQHAQYWQKNNT